jgi:hypothetical protein
MPIALGRVSEDFFTTYTEILMANLKEKAKEKIDQAAGAAKKGADKVAEKTKAGLRKGGQKMQEYGKKLEKKAR